VVFSLPIGIFGSFCLLQYLGLANDIYAQVGLVMLVGLLGKNAVLIVEFAVQQNQKGMSVLQSAIEGARVRFRPILMTSFAFIAGLIPLVRATGPGAIGNRTIGASALGGMLLGTLFGVLVVASLSRRNKLVEGESGTSITEGVSARRARLEKILEEDEAKERAAAMTSAHDAGAEQDGDEDHHAVAAAKEDGTLATSHVEEQEEDEREGVDGTTETRDETEDADNEEGEGERDE
jgi:hypothetical protein